MKHFCDYSYIVKHYLIMHLKTIQKIELFEIDLNIHPSIQFLSYENVFPPIRKRDRKGQSHLYQNCKSGRAFRVGFGPKVDKSFGLNSDLRLTFCLSCTKI